MPTLNLQGTQFTFSILPTKEKGFWVRTRLAVENEYIHYEEEDSRLSVAETEELMTALSRRLAGSYQKERSLVFERSGLIVDLLADPSGGTREELRQKDCWVVLRFLMRSSSGALLGGAQSFVLGKQEIRLLLEGLRKEWAKTPYPSDAGTGKYRFVGVSPLGYEGCNYSYYSELDVQAGEYVWVRMGRRNVEQIVLVDGVRWYNDDNAPFPPSKVKRVIRKATREEVERYKSEEKQV